LNSSCFPASDRMRHLGVEAGVGAALALVAATFAWAALPVRGAPPAQPETATLAAQAAPLPPPVFECGQPLPGRVINSPFGLRQLPWENRGRLHEGVDIAAPAGEAVRAVALGVVSRAGQNDSYGRFVELRHGQGLVSFYAHLGGIAAAARPGAVLAAGTPLGAVGGSGTSTGPHLHFEIRQHDRPLNPATFIGREFTTAADLPLKAAAYVSPRVRVAYVSAIPANKRALMAARFAVQDPGAVPAAKARLLTAKGRDGRFHGTFMKVYDYDVGLPDTLPGARPASDDVASLIEAG